LKPIEGRRVRGVAAERYPLNRVCSHPTCSEQAADPHHLFPRSMIGNDSWFVEITTDNVPKKTVIPHVTGLCRAHHEDVEEHRSWVKLEDDRFVWYRRVSRKEAEQSALQQGSFVRLGELNPQPPGAEGRRKPRPKPAGERSRNSEVIAIRIPRKELGEGERLFREQLVAAEAAIGHGDRPRSVFYTIWDALNYVVLNEGHGESTA
jgi:hypothetical protein